MAKKAKAGSPSERLFRDACGQPHMFEKSLEELLEEKRNEEVECLGLKFPNDEERRKYFLEKLQEKLNDPEFRKLEGFPVGSDEDILALSDPPYYTACPNPFVGDFIKHYGKPYDPKTDNYRREPFAADVNEGKNDPIYNAHSYHTKVPHKAIMRYILHYTEPGDVVFDGFCGTGMTGVAAQMCADRSAVEALHLKVRKDGVISNAGGERIGEIGMRHAVLCDLSPFASFVAARYNDFQPSIFSSITIRKLIEALKSEFGDYYRTNAPDSNSHGVAQFYVWSEVFACPHCAYSSPLFALAVDPATYNLKAAFSCPSCNADLSKETLDRVWTTSVNATNHQLRKDAKCELVEVSARLGARTQRFPPTRYDQEKLDHVARQAITWVPSVEFPHGRQTRKVKSGSGISTVSQMFTPRALAIVSRAWEMIHSGELSNKSRHDALFLLSSVLTLVSRRERYRDGTGKGAQSGTLYVPSLQIEKNALM